MHVNGSIAEWSNAGRWNVKDHDSFLLAIDKFGSLPWKHGMWSQISEYLGIEKSRMTTHAKMYFSHLSYKACIGLHGGAKSLHGITDDSWGGIACGVGCSSNFKKNTPLYLPSDLSDI